MSTMYSLLNYVAASSKESDGSSKMIGASPYMNVDDTATTTYVETGLRSYTDEEKRLVSISTVCVVSTLALEFKIEEVRLSYSLRAPIDFAPPTGHTSNNINVVAIYPHCRSLY